MVGTGTAGAGPQRAKPAKKEKVQGGCRRADWQPTVELRKGRRELDVVHQEQTSLEHRQQVHQSSRAPRARGALLCRRCAQMIPRRHGATDQKSDARRWNRMGQKAFQHLLGTFITSDQTTRAQDQRVGRDGGGAKASEKAASRRALCLVSAFECSPPVVCAQSACGLPGPVGRGCACRLGSL